MEVETRAAVQVGWLLISGTKRTLSGFARRKCTKVATQINIKTNKQLTSCLLVPHEAALHNSQLRMVIGPETPITQGTWQWTPILWLAETLIFSRMRVVRKATISHYPLPLFPSTNYPGWAGIKQHSWAKKSHDTLRSIISHLTSNFAGILGTENQLNYDSQKMNREIQDCWEFSSPKAEKISLSLYKYIPVLWSYWASKNFSIRNYKSV